MQTTTTPRPPASVPVDGPWRHLPPAPRRPVHAAVARLLLRRAVSRLPVRIVLPDGTTAGAGGPSDPVIEVHHDAFFHRVGASGLIGFGESYMAGDWDTDDLALALRPLSAHLPALVPSWLQRLRRWYVQRQPADEDNSLHGARRNIERHYDLSNDLFALFLDESMTYSSACFRAVAPDRPATLEAAQMAKVDRLLDVTGVGPGTRLLEIGTGWGALAVRAAQRGALVTSVTLSGEQRRAALARVEDEGLADRVDIQLCDYREVRGQYDAVVSVEMIEAVGERYWPTFFACLDDRLAPGGRVGVQAILIGHDRLVASRGEHTWVQKYIFPGGELPSLPAISATVREHTRLRIDDTFRFGHDYATTLRRWRERFDARAAEVDALGFDLRFRRMWDFYLSYAEAGFATDYLDVAQIRFTRADG